MRINKLTALLVFILLLNVEIPAQHGGGRHGGHGRHRNKVVVVKRSRFRPAKVVVYHPPAYAYHRRWVYFPGYNLYWDNWRNHYVFWNGSVWLSQPTAPPVIVNVNLEKEKSSELKETDDDEDDIYKSNEAHKNEYHGE